MVTKKTTAVGIALLTIAAMAGSPLASSGAVAGTACAELADCSEEQANLIMTGGAAVGGVGGAVGGAIAGGAAGSVPGAIVGGAKGATAGAGAGAFVGG